MQNLFTSEYHATILIEDYRAQARRHDLLAQARAGQPHRTVGGPLLARTRTAIARMLPGGERIAPPMTPACQPGMAC